MSLIIMIDKNIYLIFNNKYRTDWLISGFLGVYLNFCDTIHAVVAAGM